MASLDPDYLQMMSKTIVDIYSDATSHMIRIVASRLARGLTIDDGWATRKLLEVVELRNQAVRALDGLDNEAADAVTDVIEQAAARGSKVAATELAVTGTPAASTSTGSVDALAHETVTRLSGTHTQILRATVDAYRAVVAEVSAPGIVTGTVTRRQAAARAIDSWAAQGVTGFVDRAGRRWEIETYAEMTTRTAAGRAFMQGSIDQYQTEGHQFVIVSDAPEECAQCRPFEGKGLSLDGTGVGSRVGGIRIVATLRDAQSKGLFHQNCFPGDVRVSGPAVSAADSRWYEGELVIIHTAGGYELPVTPNHPILTTEGWVAAGSLHEGHNLVRHLGTERMNFVGPDDQQIPTMIGEIPSALRQSFPVKSMRVPSSPEQFHGDGRSGYVDVVLADGLLERHSLYPSVSQPCGHHAFLIGGMGQDALSRQSSLHEGLMGSGRTADGLVSTSHLSRSLGSTHGLPLASLGLGSSDLDSMLLYPPVDRRLSDSEGCRELILRLASDVSIDEFFDLNRSEFGNLSPFNSSLVQPVMHDADADIQSGRYLLARLASEVVLDDVVRVDRRQWSGHVYNLQTVDGWYTANGIVVHNCRHRVSPIIPGATKPMTHTADPEGDQQRQRQRTLERRIRSAKRRLTAAEQIADPEGVTIARARVRQAQADMREFIDTTGRKRLRTREQIGTAR